MIISSSNLTSVVKLLIDKFYFSKIETNFDTQYILEKFQFDYNRYFKENHIDYNNFFSRIELIGILLYRIARWFYNNGNESVALHYSNLGRLISGFEIYYSANIGNGIKINHGMGLVIGARCQIGENVLLHQNVTLGDRHGERPILMDNVTIYAGAKVLGGVRLGNNCVIGANSVCLSDVPENKKMVGIPGKIIEK
ncbi:MAG: serine O-acetyltransferase [Prevotella sp.]|jgi:serine O-acetyltransferase|nr:serine O-acetyltransferase [Prevotella sp.]